MSDKPSRRPDSSRKPDHETPQVTLSFSELKYLFECPYQFKLRFLYGFNPPIHEALGYGKGLHDALSEIHKRAIEGEILGPRRRSELVDRHLHTPFAYPALREQLCASRQSRRSSATSTPTATRSPNTDSLREADPGARRPGITVDGRIDLIRRLDTDEVAIVDFKSTERAQAEDVTRDQLQRTRSDIRS